jgi:hypothetical protein
MNKNTLAIGAIFIFLIGGLAMGANLILSDNVETKRYEERFAIHTLDMVEVEVRVFGDCDISKQSTCYIRLLEMKHRFRDALAPLQYSEIPKKLRLFMRPQIEHMNKAGIYVDSISVSRINTM